MAATTTRFTTYNGRVPGLKFITTIGIPRYASGFLKITISVALLALSGCGVPGAPLPPTTGIPKPVGDLQAVRKSDRVTLSWSTPTETADGALIRKPGKMLVYRSILGSPAQVVAELPLEPALKEEQPPPPTAKDSLTSVAQKPAGDFAVYTVLAQTASGKSAGPSNRAPVPLVPTPGAPQHFQAVTVPLGVSLSWDQAWPPQNQTHLNTEYAYRIMRRAEGSNAAVMVKQLTIGNAAMAFVDSGIEWQSHYDYWITPVTLWEGEGKKGEVEGDDSPVVSLFADDKFPPARPAGLQAVFSGMTQQPFIDLAWTPNTDPDLAGYNVYRRVGSEEPVKINSELVKGSTFRDSKVQPGSKYIYSVTGVDLRGNESEKSPEASESVPQQ